MKTLLLTLMLIVNFSCKQSASSDDSNEYQDTAKKAAVSVNYDEVWIMEGWEGHMCVVLALKGNEYSYWFFSDAGNRESMNKPLKGNFTKSPNRITLQVPDDTSVYSKDWLLRDEGDKMMLASLDDLKAHRGSDRWLSKVNPQLFEELLTHSPFVLQMNRHLDLEYNSKTKMQNKSQ